MTARDWDRLPPVDRAVADEMPVVVDHDATRAALSSHARPDPLLGSLGHTISRDGPGGIVWGLPVALGGPPRDEEPEAAEPFELETRSIVFDRPRRTLAAFGDGGPEKVEPLTKAPAREEVFRSLGTPGAPAPRSALEPHEEPEPHPKPEAPVRPRRFKGVLGPPLTSEPGDPGAAPLLPVVAEPGAQDVPRRSSQFGGAEPSRSHAPEPPHRKPAAEGMPRRSGDGEIPERTRTTLPGPPPTSKAPQSRPGKKATTPNSTVADPPASKPKAGDAPKPLSTSATPEAERDEPRAARPPATAGAEEPRPARAEIAKKSTDPSDASRTPDTVTADAEERSVLAHAPEATVLGSRARADADEKPVAANAPDATVLEAGGEERPLTGHAPDATPSEVNAVADADERPVLAHASDTTILEPTTAAGSDERPPTAHAPDATESEVSAGADAAERPVLAHAPDATVLEPTARADSDQRPVAAAASDATVAEPPSRADLDEGPVLANAPDTTILESTEPVDEGERPVLANAPDTTILESTDPMDAGERRVLGHAPDAIPSEVTTGSDSGEQPRPARAPKAAVRDSADAGERPLLGHSPDTTVLEPNDADDRRVTTPAPDATALESADAGEPLLSHSPDATALESADAGERHVTTPASDVTVREGAHAGERPLFPQDPEATVREVADAGERSVVSHALDATVREAVDGIEKPVLAHAPEGIVRKVADAGDRPLLGHGADASVVEAAAGRTADHSAETIEKHRASGQRQTVGEPSHDAPSPSNDLRRRSLGERVAQEASSVPAGELELRSGVESLPDDARPGAPVPTPAVFRDDPLVDRPLEPTVGPEPLRSDTHRPAEQAPDVDRDRTTSTFEVGPGKAATSVSRDVGTHRPKDSVADAGERAAREVYRRLAQSAAFPVDRGEPSSRSADPARVDIDRSDERAVGAPEDLRVLRPDVQADAAPDRAASPVDEAPHLEQPTRTPIAPAGPDAMPRTSRRLRTVSSFPRAPRLRAGVEPVPPTTRRAVEAATPTDLHDVEVVRGPRVAHDAAILGARAFVRDGVVHLPDALGPLETEPARTVLAHELVHVSQQRELGDALPQESSPRGRELERAAERIAASTATSLPPQVAHVDSGGALVFAPQGFAAPAPPAPAPPAPAPAPTPAAPVQRMPVERPPDNQETSQVDLDDLARRLYPRIRPYLRRELSLDRERAAMTLTSRR